ncbi:MAG TPA: GNAT family N-acetyltransferase, partial [Albitalea sp.]|nr:GNAT family N-acetyltransferase [Albitalea sp.]
KAKRARCVNAVAPGRLPLERKLDACQRLYEEVGLPMLLRITPFSEPPGLERWLEQRGMRRIDDTRVMVATRLEASAAAAPAGVTLSQVGHEAFAQIVGAMRGSSLAQRQAHGQRLVNSPVPFSAWVLKHDGEALACGQFALEHDVVGLYDVFTAAPARGRGLARLLCTHLLAEAARRGAGCAYLQVESDNHPARAVYHGLGFSDAYAYHYRTPHAGAV